jgi:hypothetical protein
MRLSTIIERARVCIMILVLVTSERMNDLGYECGGLRSSFYVCSCLNCFFWGWFVLAMTCMAKGQHYCIYIIWAQVLILWLLFILNSCYESPLIFQHLHRLLVLFLAKSPG